MSYVKQNFEKGQILKADHLNHMEDGIAYLASEVETPKDGTQIDDTTVGADAWSSKHIVDVLCPPISETGNPVQCYPVAGYPLDCKVNWEPTQAGSGEPYPAGGGVNKLNPAEYEAETKTVNGVTFTRTTTGAVKVAGTATGTAIYTLIADFAYSISISVDGGAAVVGDNVISVHGLVPGVTITRPSDNSKLYIRVASGTSVNTTVYPQLEKGSTPTAYAPYENIRPISGRTEISVERCGENLMQFSERIEDVYRQNIMRSDKLLLLSKLYAGQKITLTFTVETKDIVFAEQVEEEWKKRIGFECNGITADGKNVHALQCWLIEQNDNLSVNGKKIQTVTVVMPELVSGNIIFYAQNIQSGHYVAYGFGLYAGTTAPTAYTPYRGDTLDLALPSTIYGGTVDAVTGEGQETWKLVTLDGTENYVEEEPKQYSISLKEVSYSGKCSHFKSITLDELRNHVVGAYMKYTGKVIFNTNFSSLDEFKHYLRAQFEAGTPIQICYTRIPNVHDPTFTATGVQPIPALSGVNTVLTDADSATVTGRADPIKRITDLEDAVASMTNT